MKAYSFVFFLAVYFIYGLKVKHIGLKKMRRTCLGFVVRSSLDIFTEHLYPATVITKSLFIFGRKKVNEKIINLPEGFH
jgi:hypothetical protein